MSTEDNTPDNTPTPEESAPEAVTETPAEQPQAAAPAAAKEDPKEKAGAAAGKVLASLNNLRQQNPKVFYGAVGGVAAVLLFLMFSGGNPEVISGPGQANLVVGQTYTLKTPNAAGEKPEVRMVSTPGQMEAYDDTEETDREGCKTLPEGTRVTVKDMFKQPGMNFAKVEINDGDCKGKTMWTLAVNLH